ncbi:MAG: PAS domain S-box protein, partial [Candidatus Zixiibacteriota bacterium]
MTDASKTKSELLEELKILQQKLAKLEGTSSKKKPVKLPTKFNELFLCKQILDLIPDPIAILQNGQHKYTSRAYTELFGYTQDELSEPFSFMKNIHPDDRELILEKFEARQKGENASYINNFRMITKNSELIACESAANTIEYEGRPADLLIIRDITHRVSVENQLAESIYNYRELVETMNEGFGVINEDGILTNVNNYLCNLLGYKSAELIGRPLRMLFSEGDAELIKNTFSAHIKGQAQVNEIRLLKKNG